MLSVFTLLCLVIYFQTLKIAVRFVFAFVVGYPMTKPLAPGVFNDVKFLVYYSFLLIHPVLTNFTLIRKSATVCISSIDGCSSLIQRLSSCQL